MSNCWLCPEAFKNQHLLKKHMSTAPHSRLMVVCPWCIVKERTMNRPNELRRHAETHHRKQIGNLHPTFFSEANGFWLSMYPKDYARLTKPNGIDSGVAKDTRELVIQWHVQVMNPSRGLDDWRRGWGLDDVTVEPPRKRQALYSPSKPAITTDELTLANLEYVNRTFTAYLSSATGSWYEANLHSVIEARHSTNLMRRLLVIQGLVDAPTRPADSAQPVKLRGQILESTKEVIAANLGVPASLVTDITEWPPVFETSTSRVSVLEEDIRSEEVITFPLPPTVSRLPRPFPLSGTIISQPSPVQHLPVSFMTPITLPSVQTPRYFSSPPPALVPTTLIPTTPIPEPLPTVYGSSTPGPSSFSTPKPPNLITATSGSEQHNHYNRMLSDTPTASFRSSEPMSVGATERTQPETQKEGTSETRASIHCEDARDDDMYQLRARAMKLLRYGGMPLFPAARRDWNAINVQLPLKVGSLPWPPEGWTSLSASQRLMASEYAAMTLAFQDKIPAGITKSNLMDCFNFLVLPGSATFRIEPDEEMAHSSRVKNFQILQRVVNSGRGDDTLVGMYELVSVGRDKTLDPLVDVLDDAGIPLRL